MAIQLHPSLRTPVGIWLKEEIVEPYGQSVSSLARHFGVSRQAISELLNGHTALTETMALRFEKAFGVKADTLMRMQVAYGMAQARKHEDEIKVDRLELAA